MKKRMDDQSAVSNTKPTMVDVARMAGTSTAVVSYVLNDGPRPVAKATKARVEAAIEKLDYRPNVIAQSLRSRSAPIIGLIVPDTTNLYFNHLARLIEDSAFEAGRLVIVANGNYDERREANYVDAFGSLHAECLILATGQGTAVTKEAVDRAATRVVYLHRGVGSRGATVAADAYLAGRIATEHLRSHGYTDIACIAGPDDGPPVSERVAGWMDVLAPDISRRSLWRVPYQRHQARPVIRERLLQEQPAALFASTDEHALGALLAARDLGLAVPNDIAIVGCDGVPQSAESEPPLTTVSVRIEELAERAVAAAIGQLSDDHAERQVLKPRLVLRTSCGCSD